MSNKISFTIEDARVLEENPNSSFAVIEVDFFASGKNLHNMYVSNETLEKKSTTIKNCPVVWELDKVLDDIGTHSRGEVACGFVPETAEIKTRTLEDGRNMLSTIAYVWKKYTSNVLNFFLRDGGIKPVSVEMSVFDMKEIGDGITELLDYKFEAITLLGSYVTPAIPLAKASLLSFSDEYKEAVKKEFSHGKYSDVDFTIPEKVKASAKKALKEHAVRGGANSVVLAVARHIVNSSAISPEKIRFVSKYMKNKKGFQKDSKEELAFMLMGGKEAVEWSNAISAKLDEIDKQTFTYFEAEKNIETMEMITMDEKEKEVVEQETVAEMASDTAKDEEKETPAEEKKETPTEEKKEEEKGVEKKFAFPKNFNLEVMNTLFAEDEEEEVKMAKAELEKGEFAQPDVVMSGMFCKMCKMAEAVAKMAEDSKAYMAENEELKKFKADIEEKQKMFAVELTLKELSEKVVIPADAREEMLAEAEKYSYLELDEWKTFCKAKSFDFAIKTSSEESDVKVKVGMPFAGSVKTSKGLWDD